MLKDMHVMSFGGVKDLIVKGTQKYVILVVLYPALKLSCTVFLITGSLRGSLSLVQ
jgi:hypothetical protein